jgi:hypothetical protein
MSEKNKLNILNGQAMYNYFQQHRLSSNGVYVPFNEAMCEGEVALNIFSDQFIKCRCEAHNVTLEQYNDVVIRPLQILFENQFKQILLWFDDDMFCQINLLTLLAYLDQIGYDKKIIFNQVGHEFKVIDSFEFEVQGYYEIYKKVMIDRSIPKNIELSLMENGIRLYFEYLKEENKITSFIRQNRSLQDGELLMELFKLFPQYGLGDTQYIKLIDRCRKGN